MAEISDREMHLVKKALAIAVLAIERQLGPFQSASDQADMTALLDRLTLPAPIRELSRCHEEDTGSLGRCQEALGLILR